MWPRSAPAWTSWARRARRTWTRSSARVRPAPANSKGLAATTADLVERTAVRPEGLSASECAEAGTLSRVSARRYLEYFAGTGRAEVTLRYGGTGPPERRYRWIG
ncbi:hypothetical protein SMICM17S_04876 [Streptomyces microflavus]